MLTSIMKRDGRITVYCEDKISDAIYKAATSAAKSHPQELTYEQAQALTKQITVQLESLFTDYPPMVEDVQEIVINNLIQHQYIETSKSYILYRQERSRIRSQKSDLMKTIQEITNASTKESDIKRENANIDGNTAMGSMLQYGSTISKEYTLNYLIDPEVAKLHKDGDIHIHDLDFYSIGTLTCCQIELSKLLKNGFSTGHGHLREPQDITSYAALAAIAIQSNQNDQHGGQSIPTFDYDMAIGVQKTYRKSIKQALANFIAYHAKDWKPVLDEVINVITMDTANRGQIELINALITTYGIPQAEAQRIVVFTFNDAMKQTDRKTFQSMEGLIHNLNTMHSRAGAQVPFSSLNYGTDISAEGRMVTKNLLLAIEAGLGNGETAIFPISVFKVKEGVNYFPEDPNYDLFELACRVSAKRLFPNFSFLDAPFNKPYMKNGDPNTEVTYMGCRTRVMANVCGDEVVGGRGNISFTTINLPRLGIYHQNTANQDAFFADLDRVLDQSIKQLLQRYQLQSQKKVANFPFLMGQGIWKNSDTLSYNYTVESVINQGTLSVGFIGLAECLKALIGVHHGESTDAQQLGLKIVSFMREKLDQAAQTYQLNFSLLATPAEGLSGRFTKIDAKRFGVIPGITDKDYYTNSFHVPVYYNINAYDKISKEAPYHTLTNAGHITYVEINGDLTKNVEAFMQLVRVMKEAGIGYGSINHPVDTDTACGYQGIIDGPVCPKCGRNEIEDDLPFDRIRRITGYLVGTLDRFNQAKKAEERDRVKHA